MNIICREHLKKSYYITTQVIAKSNGYCYSSCKSIKCSFWDQKDDHSFCRLFSDYKYENKALHICNIIYNLEFIGSP